MSNLSHQELLKPFGWSAIYLLQTVIGRGASGEVWEAIRAADNKVVAIKLMLEHRIGDERLLARMEAEAEALQRLKAAGQHPGVVPILDFRLSDHSACLVMEHVPGPVLTDWCDAENPSPLQITSIMAKVAESAGWFHAQGIIHRDLKPANVIVREGTRSPVIVDFSIAKQDHELVALTLTQEALGTIPYMAPEQMGCYGGKATAATDVYALGSALYELLTGKHPHPGTLQEVSRRFSDEVAPIRPSQWNAEIPRSLEKVVMKCLSHRPQDRYPSGVELAEDLLQLADGGNVRVRGVPSLRRVWRQATKRPITSALVVGLALLLLGSAWIWEAHTEEARLRGLETQLADRLRAVTWHDTEIRDAEHWIEQLGKHGPQWRDEVAQDMVADIKAALASNAFWTADQAWIRPAAMPWLQEYQHPENAILEASLERRRGQWQAVASVAPPLTAAQNLLPADAIRLTEGGRFARLDPAPASVPEDDWIYLEKDFLSPVEVKLRLLFQEGTPIRTAVRLDYENLPIEVWLLQRGQSGPSLPADAELGDHPVALLLISGSRLAQVVAVRDDHLTSAPLELTLRFENATIHADLNGRWHLRQDELFHYASSRRPSRIALNWHRGMELEEITVRRRSTATVSLMEQADLHFRSWHLSEATRLYTHLVAQPDYASQALYKLGECQVKFGDHSKAMAYWDEGSQMDDDLWRQLCALNLWLNTARLSGPEKASVFMKRLPLPRSLHPTYKTHLGQSEQTLIRHIYRPVGRGPAIFHLPAYLALDATATWELSRASPMETASECALKLHAAGLDKAVMLVLERALVASQGTHDAETTFRLRSEALDKWQRFFVSDPDPHLDGISSNIPGWDEDETLSRLRQLQVARVLARKGSYEEAELLLKKDAGKPTGSLRHRLGQALVHGCLADLQGAAKQAKTTWTVAAQLRVEPTLDDTDLLIDAMILRTAAQVWNRESVIQLLGGFVAQDGLGIVGDDKCALFLDTFVKDDTLVHALNAIGDSTQGQALIRAAALRTSPWRVLIRDWLHLVATGYLEEACHWPQPSPTEPHPAQTAAVSLISALSSTSNASYFHQIFQHWNHPSAAGEASPTLSPPLQPALQSMLQARRNRLKQPAKTLRATQVSHSD